MGRFVLGLRYCVLGLRFVFAQHPSLRRYAVIPILLFAAACAVALWCAWQYAPQFAQHLWSTPTDPGLWGAMERAAHGLMQFLITLALSVCAFLIAALTTMVLTAPLNDALSRRVEILAGAELVAAEGWRSTLRDFLRTLGLEVLKVLTFAFVMGPLLLLSLFLPGIGQLALSLFSFMFSITYLALDFTDWPAARRDLSLAARRRMWRQRPLELLGFGFGVWLLLWVPIVNLCLIPAAVAGGTLLFLDLFVENKEKMK